MVADVSSGHTQYVKVIKTDQPHILQSYAQIQEDESAKDEGKDEASKGESKGETDAKEDAKEKAKAQAKLDYINNFNFSRQSNLEVQGMADGGEVLFRYTNPAQGIDQNFGVSIKKYIGHIKKDPPVKKMFGGEPTEEEKHDQAVGEGPYIFFPEWREPLPQDYSMLNEDVIYQQGLNVEQWSMIYNAPNNEQAIIKVLAGPALGDIIEFSVLLNSVPIDDMKSKDITVNWRMYSDFSAGKTFYTDSNGLQMNERKVQNLDRPENTVPANYYPVTGAIAMRDHRPNSGLQVTILNDRPQGGSADLTLENTIELMQHRRVLDVDNKGVGEALNETDIHDDKGIQVNAKYYMHIFDRSKGESLQR